MPTLIYALEACPLRTSDINLRDDSLSLNTFSRQLKAYLFGQ